MCVCVWRAPHTPNQELHMRPHVPRFCHNNTTILYFIIAIIHKFSWHNLQAPWRWCINTETCRSNFNINFHYLFVHTLVYIKFYKLICTVWTWKIPAPIRRSQWPRGLRRKSAAVHLLRLWVRIPQEAWMSVCCKCCVLSGRGLCFELITRPEESYRLWCVVVCDLETSRMMRLLPTGGCCSKRRRRRGRSGRC